MADENRLAQFSDLSIIYEDEAWNSLASELSMGAGEAAGYISDDEYSFVDYNEPTDHGDYNEPQATFYNMTHTNEVDYPNYRLQENDNVYDDEGEALVAEGEVADVGEEGDSCWLSDSEGEDNAQYNKTGNYGTFEMSETEEEEDYVPISKLLVNDDQRRLDWYDDPKGEDFRSAFACLKSRKALAKKYLLDILSSEAEGDEDNTSPEDLDPTVQDEVTYALSELLIPGLAKMSVEKLCDLLIKYPTLDLRGYLLDMDVFYIAYIIWGIDFYMHKKYRGFLNTEENSEENSEDEDKRFFTDSLTKCLKNSVSWLLESITPKVRHKKSEMSFVNN